MPCYTKWCIDTFNSSIKDIVEKHAEKDKKKVYNKNG